LEWILDELFLMEARMKYEVKYQQKYRALGRVSSSVGYSALGECLA